MWWRFVIGGAITATPSTVLSPASSKRSAEASGQATRTSGASAGTLLPGAGRQPGTTVCDRRFCAAGAAPSLLDQ
jgi:hypothetical protein